MQVDNFAPLKPKLPELYRFGSSAEQFVHLDPASATVKLRCFAESLVKSIYKRFEIPSIESGDLASLINDRSFADAAGQPIVLKLHAIRTNGNKAAHGKKLSVNQALWLIKEAYFLGQWAYGTFELGSSDDYPEFAEPKKLSDASEAFTDERLRDQLANARKELEEVKQSEIQITKALHEMKEAFDAVKLNTFRNASEQASSSIDFESHVTQKNMRLEDAYSDYQLAGDQLELVKQLERFLNGNSENIFLLKGYAGTGKTFITKGLTEYFRMVGRNYVLAAPTGKASKVIAEKTGSPAYTIHKTIYFFEDLKEYVADGVKGSETYKFYSKLAVNSLSVDTVYIVDEASMVSDVYQEQEFFRFGSGYLLRDFLEYVNLDHNDHRKKVIFIGDDAQLPPVGMNFSPALSAEYLRKEFGHPSTEFQLKKVVRQNAGSGVISNSMALRKCIREGAFNQLEIDTQPDDVSAVEYDHFMATYLESCDHRISRSSVVIAHSNSDVASFNQRIREHFFPGLKEVSAGDKVIATANSYTYGIFISNGDFAQIRKVLGKAEKRNISLKSKNSETKEVTTMEVPLCFRDVEIVFRDGDRKLSIFEAKIFENLLYSDTPILSSNENKALYVDFCMRHPKLKRGTNEFKQTLSSDPYFNALRLKFGYAITCHKAQGSEWDHVFVKCKTNQHQLSADYFRWFYTAITRTSNQLYLLDPPHIRIGDGLIVKPVPGVPEAGVVNSTKNAVSHKQNSSPDLNGASDTENLASPTRPGGALFVSDLQTYGIPESMTFLLNLLTAVRERIFDLDVDIEDVIHHQYQEAYIFKQGDQRERVNIHYNGSEQVRAVTPQSLSELGGELVGRLKGLVGGNLVSQKQPLAEEDTFSAEFKNQFHQRILDLLEAEPFQIASVVEYQWCQRYHFSRDEELAVFDFYFDGKDRFKKCLPVPNKSNSESLLRAVSAKLNEAF